MADSCINDAEALYLSYIVADHHDASHLLTRVPPAKAGPEQHQLDHYDTTQCRGIIYTSTNTRSKNAIKVLDLAEQERRKLAEETPSDEANDLLSSLIKTNEMPEHSRMVFMLNDHLKLNTHRRRTSGSTNGHMGLSGTHPKAMSDLDRARSRIQGEEMEKTGQYGNDLWRRALIMLCLCREIQYPRPKEISLPTHSLFRPDRSDRLGVGLLLEDDFPELPSLSPPKPTKPIVKTLEVPGYPMRKSKPLAPLLPLGNGNPNQAMLPRSHLTQKPSVLEISISPLSSIPPQIPSPTFKFSDATASLKAKEYRSQLPCGFAEEIWWRILGGAAGADKILSKSQQQSVLSWAMDRNTLRQEHEWLSEKEGNQIWHVLDGMSCLAYEYDG